MPLPAQQPDPTTAHPLTQSPELTATAAEFHPLNAVPTAAHIHTDGYTPFDPYAPSAVDSIPADQQAPDGFALNWAIHLGDDPAAATLQFTDGTITLLQITLTPDVVADLTGALIDVADAQGEPIDLTEYLEEPGIPDEPGWDRIKARFNPDHWITWFNDPDNRLQRNVYLAAAGLMLFLSIIGLLR